MDGMLCVRRPSGVDSSTDDAFRKTAAIGGSRVATSVGAIAVRSLWWPSMRSNMSKEPRVSIVIPAYNEAHRLRETILAVRDTADLSYEIVVVDDASTDGCADGVEDAERDDTVVYRAAQPLGVAAARNFGASKARAPIVLFMDAHCYPEPAFLTTMVGALSRLGRGMVVPQVTAVGDSSARGFGMTIGGPSLAPAWLSSPEFADPHPVPVGCGCVQMFYRSWFHQIGGYERFRRYGIEDTEISIRSWLMGGPVQVVPKAQVAHYFRSRTTCEVTWSDVVYNVLRMAHLHFAGSRLEAVERHWARHWSYGEAKSLLSTSDVDERRAWFDVKRQHSADWYCLKFAIPI
jgi:GT2 family glycosyltransferase